VTARDLYMPRERYLGALRRQRDRIAADLPFAAEDSDVTGDKWTHASWGLCSRDAEAWPDAGDHLWPDQFRDHGRVAPRYLREDQPCPLQGARKPAGQGCFYSCRIFRSRQVTARTRDAALALYDAAIAREEAR
jgi:hypothetical protein